MTISKTPPRDALKAILSGTTQVIRRIEIHESDGETLWLPIEDIRLEDGSISIDYSRDERRTLDSLVLNNEDRKLIPTPFGFWYDKIIKPFRGVRYPVSSRNPSVVIINSSDNNKAYELRGVFSQLGISDVAVKRNASTVAQLEDYDVIVVDGRDQGMINPDLISDLFDVGENIFTIGKDLTDAEIPFITTVAASGVPDWGITPTVSDSPLRGTFTEESYPAASGTWITDTATGAIPVATWQPAGAGTPYVTSVIKENNSGGRWFHFHADSYGTQARSLWFAALDWLYQYEPYREWETQMGEFCIDKISRQNFPHSVSVSGRDYTKRCLTSKLEKSMSFAAGTPLKNIVEALAANAGIKKMMLPTLTDAIKDRIDIERGTTRWEVMKKAAESLNYELYFDSYGFLVMREFLDPLTSPVVTTFETGPEVGNLASLDQSVNDSRLYNHVVITGERESQDGANVALPYFGEAKNTDPSSPTNIDRIGDRAYFYTSTFFTNDQQCQALAESWIKTKALESFELSISTLNYIWLEAGDIVEILDPDRVETDPTRYLLDTMSVSLMLGPMSATAKRVTYVGSDSGPSSSELAEEEEVA